MGKKKFEQQPYNPLEAYLMRGVARVGREPAPALEDTAPALEVSPKVVELPTAARPPAPRPGKRKPGRSMLREQPQVTKRSERFVAKRFELTRDEDAEFEAFISRIQAASGVRVPVSVLLRACCTLLQQGENALTAEVERAPFRGLPSTGDDLGYGEFEDRWTQLVRTALRWTLREGEPQ